MQDQQELLVKSAFERLNKDQRPFTSALSFQSVHQTSVLFDIYYFTNNICTMKVVISQILFEK